METCVVELVAIARAYFVDDACAVAFVTEVASLLGEVVFYLFLDVEVEEALHHFEQCIRVL